MVNVIYSKKYDQIVTNKMKFSNDGIRVRNFKVTRCYRGLIVYVKHGYRLRIGS
jgi:hypothetical protein